MSTELPNDAQSRAILSKIDALESNGSNYTTWKLRMESAFAMGGVSDVIKGTNKGEGDAKVKALYDLKLERAKAYIIQGLKDAELMRIAHLNAYDAWNFLSTTYEINRTSILAGILATLNLLASTKSSDLDRFLRDHDEILSRSTSLQLPLVRDPSTVTEEKDKRETKDLNQVYSTFILNGLPNEPQWETFRSIYESDTTTDYNPRKLLDLIRQHQHKQQIRNISKTSNPLLTSTPSPTSSRSDNALASSSKTDTRSVKYPPCKHCKQSKPRHSVDKCWQNPRNPNNRIKSESKGKNGGKGKEEKKEEKEGGNQSSSRGKGTTYISIGGKDDEKCAVVTAVGKEGSNWYLDSCASLHIASSKSSFTDLKPFNDSVGTAKKGSSPMEIKGIGTVELESTINGQHKVITLHNVNYVPSSKYNLLSVPEFQKAGIACHFLNDVDSTVIVGDQEDPIFKGNSMDDGIAKLDFQSETVAAVIPSSSDRQSTILHLHRLLAHPGKGAMRDLLKAGLMKGCTTVDLDTFFSKDCITCLKGKATSAPYPTSTSLTSIPLALVHSDIAGPYKDARSWSGATMIIFIIDEATGWLEAEPLKTKSSSEIVEKVETMPLRMKRDLGHLIPANAPVSHFRSDNGTEYTSNEFQDLLLRHQFLHQTSIPYKPQQNGKSERTVRTIKDTITTLLADAQLSRRYWAEALRYAVFTINHLPSTSLKGETPYHLVLSHNDPILEHLPLFGQTVWVNDPESRVFESKATEARFLSLGLPYGKKAFRLQRIGSSGGEGVFWARDIYFSKDDVELKKGDQDIEDEEEEEPYVEEIKEVEEEKSEEKRETSEKKGSVPKDMTEEDLAKRWGATDEGRRPRNPTTKASSAVALFTHSFAPLIENDEDVGLLVRKAKILDLKGRPSPSLPSSPTEAITSVYSEEWRESMEDEIKGLELQGAWDLVKKQEGENTIGSRWHYSIKTDADGNPTKLKARLVAQGVKTLPFLAAYGPRNAPLVPYQIVLLFLTIVSHYRLYCVTTDFIKGYLAAPTTLISDSPILMRQPPLFENPQLPTYVCLLRKAIYGLPQSGRAFHL